jgi:hypothetical protein
MDKPPASSQIPLGKFAWPVVGAVLLAPLLFFALVTPMEQPEAVPPRLELPPSKLKAAGLRENRDWDGLPDIFAIWAPRAHWQADRTRFSWWNPGTESYSYFFEARRTPQGFWFKEIREPKDEGFEWDRDADTDSPIRLYLPIRPRWHDPVRPVEEQGTRPAHPRPVKSEPPKRP